MGTRRYAGGAGRDHHGPARGRRRLCGWEALPDLVCRVRAIRVQTKDPLTPNRSVHEHFNSVSPRPTASAAPGHLRNSRRPVLGFFVRTLDVVVLIVALPSIRGDLGSGISVACGLAGRRPVRAGRGRLRCAAGPLTPATAQSTSKIIRGAAGRSDTSRSVTTAIMSNRWRGLLPLARRMVHTLALQNPSRRHLISTTPGCAGGQRASLIQGRPRSPGIDVGVGGWRVRLSRRAGPRCSRTGEARETPGFLLGQPSGRRRYRHPCHNSQEGGNGHNRGLHQRREREGGPAGQGHGSAGFVRATPRSAMCRCIASRRARGR